MRSSWSVLVAMVVVPVLASCDTGPNCLTISGQFDPAAPDLVIDYRRDIDAVAMTDTLAARYGFTPIIVRAEFKSAEIPAPQPAPVLDGLRCEPSIKDIWYDAPIYPN